MPAHTRRRHGADTTPRDHYAEVTAQVIASLEAGTLPWRQPWDNAKAGGPAMPQNAVTGSRYRGINVVTLGMSPLAFMTSDPRWATYKQAQQRGWQVKKGSRGTTGFFYKRLEVERDDTSDADEKRGMWIPLLRAFALFHASQIEVSHPTYHRVSQKHLGGHRMQPKQSCATAAPTCGSAETVPSTRPQRTISRCRRNVRSAAAWASVRLHELSHWSGAPSRLNRDLSARFGSAEYSREEIKAELGQIMLCGVLGIEECDFTNGTAYVAHWLQRLRGDKREIFRAAAEAQRIADYLLAFHPDYVADPRQDGVESGEASEDTLSSFPEAA